MYVRTYVCMYVYVCVCMYVCMYVHVYVYTCIMDVYMHVNWPCGPMDKASDYGSGDSRFKSWQGQ